MRHKLTLHRGSHLNFWLGVALNYSLATASRKEGSIKGSTGYQRMHRTVRSHNLSVC